VLARAVRERLDIYISRAIETRRTCVFLGRIIRRAFWRQCDGSAVCVVLVSNHCGGLKAFGRQQEREIYIYMFGHADWWTVVVVVFVVFVNGWRSSLLRRFFLPSIVVFR
jgi:hypothetical protein